MNTLNSHRAHGQALKQRAHHWPDQLLRGTAVFWLVSVLLGQWAFFYYLMAFYGVSVITDNLVLWNVFEQFGATPYKSGDTLGNSAFGSHALGAGIVAIAGGLQLLPQIRHRFPTFHRWNGRVFLSTCVLLTFSGLYLVWIRNEPPRAVSDLQTTLNGLLILAFCYFTLRRVLDRDIVSHRRWAIRLFLVANGQWFLRVGTFCYLTFGNLLGKASFDDPFFVFWNFGAFLLPLAVLELYFLAKDRSNPSLKIFTALVVFVLTILMITGILALALLLSKIIAGQPLGL